ncbi:MAG TPA: hypothetical protein VIT41_07260 [Microlunatus sp.]
MLTSESGPDRLPIASDHAGDDADLVRRVIAGDVSAAAQVLGLAPTCDDPALLVASAVLSRDPRPLDRAAACARTARDRQLVVLADAHLRGDRELFSVLVREHLSEYPDHLLAAWIAAEHS